MSKRIVTLSVIIALAVLSAFSEVLRAQDNANVSAEYKVLLENIEDLRRQLQKANEDRDTELYNKLIKEWEPLQKEKTRLEEIMSQNVKTKQKISEVNRIYNDGLNAYKIQRYSDALGKFSEAIAKGEELENPLVYDAVMKSYFGIGNVYLKQKNYSAMIEPLQMAIEINPNYYGAYNLIARSYERQGRMNDAIANYKKSVETNNSKENFTAHFNMGVVYLNKKDYKNARKEFLHSIERNPSHARSFLYLGRAYFQLKDNKNAEAAFVQSIQLSEKLWQPHYFLTQVFYKIGKYKEVIRSANNTMKYHPNKTGFGGALVERGRAHVKLGNNAKALEDFNAAAKDRRYRKNAEYEIEILTKFGGKKG